MDSNQPPDTQRRAGEKPDGMRIGPVPFLGVLVFGILILLPWTRGFGVAMMLLLAIPILIGWARARRLTDGSRGLTSANATLCGLMVIVGAALSPSAPPASTPTETAVSVAAPQAVAPQHWVQPPVAMAPALPPAPMAQPRTPVTTPRPAMTPTPAYVKGAPSARAATPSPAKAKPKVPATACGGESYINSKGNCVRRPVESVSEPGGATAKCKDGKYSFSQSRRGTCSGHGGVAEWL